MPECEARGMHSFRRRIFPSEGVENQQTKQAARIHGNHVKVLYAKIVEQKTLITKYSRLKFKTITFRYNPEFIDRAIPDK